MKDWNEAYAAGINAREVADAAWSLPAPAEADRATPPLPLICAADWEGATVTDVQWLAHNRIPLGDVTAQLGDGGSGKTLLMAQLAAAVVLGEIGWTGAVTAQGPTLFFSGEEPEAEMHRRFARICAHHGRELRDLRHLHLHFPAADDCVLGLAGKDNVKPTPLFQRFEAAAVKLRPVLIVVDNIAATFAGDHIHRAQARSYVSLFRALAARTGAAVVLIDHPSQSGMATGSGRAGSTDWSNSVRSRLYLKRPPDDDDRDVRELEVMKSNYGPEGEKVALRWTDGVFVPQAASALDALAAEAKVDDLFCRLLAQATAQGRNVSPKPSGSWAPKVFEAMPDAGGVKRKAFAAAMERLLSAGKIRSEHNGRSYSVVRTDHA